MTVLELTMNRALAGIVDAVDVGFASRLAGAVDRSGEVEMDQIALDKARSSITPTETQALHRLIGTFTRYDSRGESRRVLFEEPIYHGQGIGGHHDEGAQDGQAEFSCVDEDSSPPVGCPAQADVG